MKPFLNCNFTLNMDILFEDLNSFKWEKHGHNMPSCYIPKHYEVELKKIFNLPGRVYISVHNLPPSASTSKKDIPYLTNWHIDHHRVSAILIPISLDNENHYTEFMIDGEIEKAPYKRGVPLLFDVKVRHKVTNTDPTHYRNMISIGLSDVTYTKLVDLYNSGVLINYSDFSTNCFIPVMN